MQICGKFCAPALHFVAALFIRLYSVLVPFLVINGIGAVVLKDMMLPGAAFTKFLWGYFIFVTVVSFVYSYRECKLGLKM